MTGPETWGPHGWKFIHYVTLGYPEKPNNAQKERYKAFFLLLKDVLPCALCADHYAQNLKKMMITDDILNDREKLIKWGIDFHNLVNASKNKPIVDYADARRMIETDNECKQNRVTITKNIIIKKNNNLNITYGLIAILAVLIFIAVIYKKN
jgi:hypothetical protein